MTSETRDHSKRNAPAAASADSSAPDFPRDLGGDRAQYEAKLCEEAEKALVKYSKSSQSKRQFPVPDT